MDAVNGIRGANEEIVMLNNENRPQHVLYKFIITLENL